MQRLLSLPNAVATILVPVLTVLAAATIRDLPDRRPLPPLSIPVTFEPLAVRGPAKVWAVRVDDPRWGGVSALGARPDGFLALTDSGVTVHVPRPGEAGKARVRDLPEAPGRQDQKRGRDSEALVRTARGDWLVAFENRHSLWRYDPQFRRGTSFLDLRPLGWGPNKGVEGLVALPSGDLLLFPERATEVVRVGRDQRLTRHPLKGASGEISDATLLPDGRVIVLMRLFGLGGLSSRLALLEKSGASYRLLSLGDIAVGPFTNLEAIAAEPLPSGATRLWLMSDNDFSSWRRTILVATEIAAGELPQRR